MKNKNDENRKDWHDAIKQMHDRIEAHIGDNKDRQLFRDHLKSVLSQSLEYYDVEFEISMGPPPDVDFHVNEIKKELDSVMVVVDHYREFCSRRQRKPPEPEANDFILIRNVTGLFTDPAPDLNRNPYSLTEFLNSGKVTAVTLRGHNGKKFIIEHPEIIRQVIWKIEPYAMYLGEKPGRGQPKSKLYGIIHQVRKTLNERMKRIPSEFLWESFKRVNEDEVPDYESFKKTLAAAMK